MKSLGKGLLLCAREGADAQGDGVGIDKGKWQGGIEVGAVCCGVVALAVVQTEVGMAASDAVGDESPRVRPLVLCLGHEMEVDVAACLPQAYDIHRVTLGHRRGVA